MEDKEKYNESSSECYAKVGLKSDLLGNTIPNPRDCQKPTGHNVPPSNYKVDTKPIEPKEDNELYEFYFSKKILKDYILQFNSLNTNIVPCAMISGEYILYNHRIKKGDKLASMCDDLIKIGEGYMKDVAHIICEGDLWQYISTKILQDDELIYWTKFDNKFENKAVDGLYEFYFSKRILKIQTSQSFIISERMVACIRINNEEVVYNYRRPKGTQCELPVDYNLIKIGEGYMKDVSYKPYSEFYKLYLSTTASLLKDDEFLVWYDDDVKKDGKTYEFYSSRKMIIERIETCPVDGERKSYTFVNINGTLKEYTYCKEKDVECELPKYDDLIKIGEATKDKITHKSFYLMDCEIHYCGSDSDNLV